MKSFEEEVITQNKQFWKVKSYMSTVNGNNTEQSQNYTYTSIASKKITFLFKSHI